MHLKFFRFLALFFKRNLSFLFLLYFILFFIPLRLNSEGTGSKYYKNYTYKEYDHQPQNWGIAQAPNGIIYVANQGGVLEFDGVSWQIIGIPGYSPTISIAIDKAGTIYIGGIGDFGYLAPNSQGTLKYNSLTSFIPPLQEKFSKIWKTYISNDKVFFQSDKYLFRWNSREKKMKVWTPKGRFYFSFLCAGKLFIRQSKTGLMEITGDTMQPVPGGDIFKDKKIYMMVPYDIPHSSGPSASESILIGTDTEGFYLYDGIDIRPFPMKAASYLKRNKLYHGIRLYSGDYALATRRGGLVIMGPRGHIKYIWDKTVGIQDDRVYYVFEDEEKNLWLGLSKGISKIENASPLSFYDESSGLSGIVMTVTRYKKDLYAGATGGLFYLETPYKFTSVPGITGSCWSLVSLNDSLLAATSEGVFQVDKEKKTQLQIIKEPAVVLCASEYYPGRVWCGTGDRLVLLSRNNKHWQEEFRFKSIKQEIRSIAEEKNGNLWLVTTSRSVIKMDFKKNFNEPIVTWYETSHGLPGGHIYAAPAAGHIMFATEKGLYRFDNRKNVFIPDNTIGGNFTGSPKARSVFRIVEDSVKNIWIQSESRNYQAIPTSTGTFRIYDIPFRRIPLSQVNDIYPESNRKKTWFGSFDGIFCYDASVKKDYALAFPTLLRKVRVNDEVIHDGCKKETMKDITKAFPIFNYKKRNFYFQFALPYFEAEAETLYSCFLDGYDETWSTWNKDNKRNYTNLDPGVYTFRVQGKNIYGMTGDEAKFRFKILLPWYREWWAYLLYLGGVLFLGFLAVKWRSAKLAQDKQQLEYTVKERTKEIQAKNLQLKEQSDKLKELDNVKSRFFANLSHEFRTPLTLIIGPLEQMLSDNIERMQKKKLDVMLRNAQRLLTLINRLLDLSRFDSGKVKLLTSCQDIIPFLKGIIASFQLAARKSQLKLEFNSEIDSLDIYFDSPKMEEVIYNLLINAFRYTSPGGNIKVTVSLPPLQPLTGSGLPIKKQTEIRFVNISIIDTGKGIAKEQLPYIFDRFYQVENSKQEVLKGTGIGLSLVKENVLLHYGKIDVHSQEGKGTEFVIQLPMGNEHLKAEEIEDKDAVPPSLTVKKSETDLQLLLSYNNSEEEIDEDKNKGNDSDTKVEKEKADKREQEKPVILVVEDNVDVRKYICDSLKPNYSTIEAEDGQEGIEKARDSIPDLIVSDIMMPEVDGCQLCRVLKTDIKTSHIPIILLTAKASEESIIQGLETGADDYVTKPFNAKILLTRIKNLIELRRQLQQKIQKQLLLQPAEIEVSSMDREFIEELQTVIEKNLSNSDFNVEQLSKKLYMNRATLYRKLMALTGETPTDFIRSYRLKRAAQLLRDKFGNVSQVSLEVGFSNIGYFSKCFKEKFHESPLSYQASESK